MIKVIGLGGCVYDTIIKCENFPTEDTKTKAENLMVSGGGPVGNALVIMSKLGVSTGVLGLFGNDLLAEYLINDFIKYNIDVSGAKKVENTTSFSSYIILSNNKKTRTCVYDRGTVPDDPSYLNFSALDNASILHLDGNYINCAIKAAKYAKEKGVLVSLDAGGLYKDINKLLPMVDILIPSAEFAKGFTGENTVIDAILKLQNTFNPKVLVVTDGDNGGYYYDNGKVLHYESYKTSAIDTNGAGDTFHGAFISAYLENKDILSCCKFASAVSSFKCSNMGVRTFELNKDIIKEKYGV